MRGLRWRWGYGYLDSVAFVVGAPGYLDSFVRGSSTVCGAWLVIGRWQLELRAFVDFVGIEADAFVLRVRGCRSSEEFGQEVVLSKRRFMVFG